MITTEQRVKILMEYGDWLVNKASKLPGWPDEVIKIIDEYNKTYKSLQ